MRIGLYDNRQNSKTTGEVTEVIIGERNPVLVQIPPRVIHGFESNIDEESIIVSIPTEPYNYKTPDEYRLDPFSNDIPFKWKGKKGG